MKIVVREMCAIGTAALLAGLLATVSTSIQATPITLQGNLTVDATGDPAAGERPFEVTFYDIAADTSISPSITGTTIVDANGFFSLVVDIPDTVAALDQPGYLLAIGAPGASEVGPDDQFPEVFSITSVPRSVDSKLLGGTPASSFVTESTLNSYGLQDAYDAGQTIQASSGPVLIQENGVEVRSAQGDSVAALEPGQNNFGILSLGDTSSGSGVTLEGASNLGIGGVLNLFPTTVGGTPPSGPGVSAFGGVENESGISGTGLVVQGFNRSQTRMEGTEFSVTSNGNPRATIGYGLGESADGRIRLYNESGDKTTEFEPDGDGAGQMALFNDSGQSTMKLFSTDPLNFSSGGTLQLVARSADGIFEMTGVEATAGFNDGDGPQEAHVTVYGRDSRVKIDADSIFTPLSANQFLLATDPDDGTELELRYGIRNRVGLYGGTENGAPSFVLYDPETGNDQRLSATLDGGGGAQLDLDDDNNNRTIRLKAGSGGSAPAMILESGQTAGPKKRAEFTVSASDGGEMNLFASTDNATIEAIAESGAGGGAFMRIRNDSGVRTIRLDGDENDAGFLSVHDSNGNAQASIDGATGVVQASNFSSTRGADVAELFHVATLEGRSAEPGDLVCLDPDNPGSLMIATEPYDRRVVGIVSGAGGIQSAMTLSQHGTLADGDTAVSLSGRVYCKAVGPVAVGDMLTTSAQAGNAMAATDPSRRSGAVIGKAMTPLNNEEQGLVLVLVSLQ